MQPEKRTRREEKGDSSSGKGYTEELRKAHSDTVRALELGEDTVPRCLSGDVSNMALVTESKASSVLHIYYPHAYDKDASIGALRIAEKGECLLAAEGLACGTCASRAAGELLARFCFGKKRLCAKNEVGYKEVCQLLKFLQKTRMRYTKNEKLAPQEMQYCPAESWMKHNKPQSETAKINFVCLVSLLKDVVDNYARQDAKHPTSTISVCTFVTMHMVWFGLDTAKKNEFVCKNNADNLVTRINEICKSQIADISLQPLHFMDAFFDAIASKLKRLAVLNMFYNTMIKCIVDYNLIQGQNGVKSGDIRKCTYNRYTSQMLYALASLEFEDQELNYFLQTLQAFETNIGSPTKRESMQNNLVLCAQGCEVVLAACSDMLTLNPVHPPQELCIGCQFNQLCAAKFWQAVVHCVYAIQQTSVISMFGFFEDVNDRSCYARMSCNMLVLACLGDFAWRKVFDNKDQRSKKSSGLHLVFQRHLQRSKSNATLASTVPWFFEALPNVNMHMTLCDAPDTLESPSKVFCSWLKHSNFANAPLFALNVDQSSQAKLNHATICVCNNTVTKSSMAIPYKQVYSNSWVFHTDVKSLQRDSQFKKTVRKSDNKAMNKESASSKKFHIYCLTAGSSNAEYQKIETTRMIATRENFLTQLYKQPKTFAQSAPHPNAVIVTETELQSLRRKYDPKFPFALLGNEMSICIYPHSKQGFVRFLSGCNHYDPNHDELWQTMASVGEQLIAEANTAQQGLHYLANHC